ncbi:DDE-type integrase/transposase/recombinase [Mycobacterium sp. SM1]|uniref:DDE-type integrase/transposase/recombinase n=1 Tax=Mycobacterium sp. SM1 TaxID=2816243 RepID=UPI001BCD6DF8|nr:DDE-type integrase/transposase/recombinase [Mycobacterium sp. SM1]MBS4730164.1 DDE-type integrase/transposase/recombinase [Mycobacterium sp. SM1]
MPKDPLTRRFDTAILNRVWTSDITYLDTGAGWLYLCAVRDNCSRRVIGWGGDECLHTDLVRAAVQRAVAMRGELAQRLVVHADRGCQCTSAQLARLAREHLARSVGRTALCWDSAQQESFWATLKVEFYDRYLWPTKTAATLAVGDGIERVYSRPQRSFGPRYDEAGRVRRPTHSDGTSRLTLCPPNGVKPRSGGFRIWRGSRVLINESW